MLSKGRGRGGTTKAYVCSVCLRQMLRGCFADADPVDFFHHKYGGSTSIPHPWDFEPVVVAQIFGGAEEPQERRLPDVVAFVCELRFHGLQRFKNLCQYSIESRTWIVRSKNRPLGSNFPAVKSSLIYPKSLSIELAILGNCIFTATRSSLPVGDIGAARTAVCTCPMDAAANGIRSKDTKLSDHDGPSAVCMTCCLAVRSVLSAHDGGGAHLHLPVRHVVRAILHPAEYLVDLRRQDVGICSRA